MNLSWGIVLAFAVCFVSGMNIAKRPSGGKSCRGLNVISPGDECVVQPDCKGQEKAKYRTVDGSCNNLVVPSWGQAETPFSRLLQAKYSGPGNTPALSQSGQPLPNSRNARLEVLPEAEENHPLHTLLLMTWGQTIAHDITFSVGQKASCCPKPDQTSSCLPIETCPNDPVYGPTERCLDLVRTENTGQRGCSLETEQIAGVSAYLDGSICYGSDEKTASSLRTYEGGLLKTLSWQGHEYLPDERDPDINPSFQCVPQAEHCFFAGDVRVNQNPHIVSIQTGLLRLHNWLVGKLSEVNPHWDDETLYQQGRRILSAVLQHITYDEWLTLIIGEEAMTKWNLKSPEVGSYSDDYDSSLNAATMNEFTAGCFRYFHTLVQSTIQLHSDQGEQQGSIFLRDWMNNPDILLDSDNVDNIDAILRGMSYQPAGKADNKFTGDVCNHLFQGNSTLGGDLVTLDIKRGVDHGIASHTEMVKHILDLDVKSFDDLQALIPSESIEGLKKVYEYVEDVPFFTGLALETPVENAEIGPTCVPIIAQQFTSWKQGDRYYWTNKENPYPFTPEQLTEINKMDLRTLFCTIGNNIKNMPLNPFKIGSEIAPCPPPISLDAWKET